MKIEAHILRGPSKAKTACATCQPPVVLRSPNLRRSYSIIRLYHHTKGKVHTISPSCSIRGGVLFQKSTPPLYRRCVWKTYTDEGLMITLECQISGGGKNMFERINKWGVNNFRGSKYTENCMLLKQLGLSQFRMQKN